MKKHLFLFSLLIFLVSGACKNPARSSTNAPGIGYGRISVSCLPHSASDTYSASDAARSIARTVLPSPVFDKYVYTFTKVGTTTGAELTPDSGGFFTLETGNYTVEAQAFAVYEGFLSLAASGVSEPFNVGPGENEPVVVPLRAISKGQGKFSYAITYPLGAWAEIIMEQWQGVDDIYLEPSPLSEANGLTETLKLEAGIYLLTVQVNKDGQSAGITEAVYIYPSLTTVYAKDFVDEDFHDPTQNVTPDRFLYYWVDQHDSLVTTNDGKNTIAPGKILAIAAQSDSYTVHDWHLDGISTGQSGNTYYFTSASAGQHTVGLFVEKDGKLYNTNIAVTVENAAEPVTRSVTIDMYDSIGDGWQGSGAIRINLNGINIANVKVAISNGQNTPTGQRYTNAYTFPVTTGDVVQLYWVAGSSQGDNSFIAYYTDAPPVPVFCTDNKGAQRWTGENALIFKIRGAAPDGLANAADGALLGEFTVN